MAAASWNKFGNAGGWQVPGMPGMPPRKKKDDYDVWSLPGVVAGSNRTDVGNPNVPYTQNYSGAAGKIMSPFPKDMMVRQKSNQATGNVNAGPLGGYGDPAFREKYNAGAAIKAANEDKSYSDMQFGENLNAPWRQGSRILEEQKALRGIEEGGGGAWYDQLWQGAKDMGLKGWGELGVGAMNAYTGWQKTKMAEKQHGLAMDTFNFQKAAYEEDRQGRVLAYNTNAQNVNAWKEAQGRTDLNTLMV